MSKTPTSPEPKKGPLKSFFESGVQVAVWEKKIDDKTYYDISVQKSYKVGDTWKYGSSFRLGDLPVLTKLLAQATALITSL